MWLMLRLIRVKLKKFKTIKLNLVGVLTVTIYDEAALIKHEEKEIKKIDLDELDYPETK